MGQEHGDEDHRNDVNLYDAYEVLLSCRCASTMLGAVKTSIAK